jgi:DNA processing protein
VVTDPVEVRPGEEDYPIGLLDLEEPPRIWLRGTPGSRPCVAVVGTRRCTRYGIELADAFGRALAASGWTTVSGLARGIDTAAHRGCLRVKGHAIAVLGSGIDVCYPRENWPVYASILANDGAVISEYPPGTPPDRWRFPARNRLIAAMSAAVVVVEAAVTGGALITARLGAEMGRPVFVVPGDVDREMSEGCNRLIRDGAYPVLGSSDLIEELSLVIGPPDRRLDTGTGVPAEGISVGELPGLWQLTFTETLVKLGLMEMEGKVRREGDLIVPT